MFISSARRRWQTLVILAAALAASRWVSPDPQVLGLLTASAAIVMIVRPHWDWIAAASAGLLIGGLKYSAWFVAFALASAVAAYAIPVPRRVIREEALAGLAIFGFLLALAPSVAAGWQSALALNVVSQTGSGQAVPNWVLLFVASSIVVGGLYQGLYKRR